MGAPLRRRRRPPALPRRAPGSLAALVACLALLLLGLVAPAHAALVDFESCAGAPAINSDGSTPLHWVPLYVDARWAPVAPGSNRYNLSVATYGNVTGHTFPEPVLPPAYDSAYWANPNFTNGKIANLSAGAEPHNITSFLATYSLLTMQAGSSANMVFCNQTWPGTSCPIAPVFNDTAIARSNFTLLRAFGNTHTFTGSYAFGTVSANFRVNAGDVDAEGKPILLACLNAAVTPDLGASLAALVAYLPVVILFFVASAVVAASVFSPWGTTDVFKWTSNYGRDQDLIRLVTPGFGDCLQYIQFVILAGSLSLNYPGFFQPIVSQVSWSCLMFNLSFVSHQPGVQNPVDGVYSTFGRYGLSRMRQLIGLAQDYDIWAGTVIWALVIIAIVVIAIQLGFFSSWVTRMIARTTPEDLRSKNWPFTGGCFVRIVCNFFLLPIVSLSLFQLVIAVQSPNSVVALAVVLIVFLLVFAGWILKVIFTAKPRGKLFDDLSTVLLYGPLYNTYSDEAALFALIPAMLTFVRGIAIGAIQPSGIAQIIILAICEVVLILTLNAFRPFHSPTSMNAYHTTFAVVRLITILLSIAFVPQLDYSVSDGVKGWIGYTILVLHALVMVFGYFMNAVQTLIEVTARALGAGGDASTGAATRGGLVRIFGARQLSRRHRRTHPGFRSSSHSDAAILTEHAESKSQHYPRSRSISASSAILLNRRSRDQLSGPLDHASSSMGMDTPVGENTYAFPMSPTVPGDVTAMDGRPALGINTKDLQQDPYYRAPRQNRRLTGEMPTPGSRSRGSIGTEGPWGEGNARVSGPLESTAAAAGAGAGAAAGAGPASGDLTRGASFSPDRYMRERDGNDPAIQRRTNVDYAVREVDFYYGVRGPALNSEQPSRRLKTGPADPVGPVSSATGWFKTMFGRKSKDKVKGFEVVRSTRAPPERFADEAGPAFQEPYRDNPALQDEDGPIPGQKTRSIRGTESTETTGEDIADARRSDNDAGPSPINSQDDEFDLSRNRVSKDAPSLLPLDLGGSIELPSRMGSQVSSMSRQQPTGAPSRAVSSAGTARPADEPVLLPAIEEPLEMPNRRASRLQRSASPRVPFMSNRHSLGADSILSLEHEAAHDETAGEDLTRQPTSEWGAFHGQTRGSLNLETRSRTDTTQSSRPSADAPSGESGLSPPQIRAERPTSMGQVSFHRASDGMHLGQSIGAAEHAAEILPGSPSHSRGPSNASNGEWGRAV